MEENQECMQFQYQKKNTIFKNQENLVNNVCIQCLEKDEKNQNCNHCQNKITTLQYIKKQLEPVKCELKCQNCEKKIYDKQRIFYCACKGSIINENTVISCENCYFKENSINQYDGFQDDEGVQDFLKKGSQDVGEFCSICQIQITEKEHYLRSNFEGNMEKNKNYCFECYYKGDDSYLTTDELAKLEEQIRQENIETIQKEMKKHPEFNYMYKQILNISKNFQEIYKCENQDDIQFSNFQYFLKSFLVQYQFQYFPLIVRYPQNINYFLKQQQSQKNAPINNNNNDKKTENEGLNNLLSLSKQNSKIQEDQESLNSDDLHKNLLELPTLSRVFTKAPTERNQSQISQNQQQISEEQGKNQEELQINQYQNNDKKFEDITDKELLQWTYYSILGFLSILASDETKKNVKLYNFVQYGDKLLFESELQAIYYFNKSLNQKVDYMRSITKKIALQNLSQDGYYYSLDININRNNIWYSSLSELSQFQPQLIAIKKLEITFDEEDGIDAGGLSREWFQIIFSELLDQNNGFFKASSNGLSFQPSEKAIFIPDFQLHFKFAGRIVAKALLDNYECEIQLTRSFLKHLLQKDLYIQDLEDIDPELCKNLLWILENDITGLDMNFVYTSEQFGENLEIELKENGANIIVDENNKKEYVKLIANYKMTTQIELQTQAFIQGFYEVIPQKAMKFLNEVELGLKLYGVKEIDIQDMKNNMKYQSYNENSQQVIWLWEVLESYSNEMKEAFLFFITGSFKVPYGGFKNFNLQISQQGQINQLPCAHTCSREIDLPPYQSKEILEQKLTVALQEGSKGFYIG